MTWGKSISRIPSDKSNVSPTQHQDNPQNHRSDNKCIHNFLYLIPHIIIIYSPLMTTMRTTNTIHTIHYALHTNNNIIYYIHLNV